MKPIKEGKVREIYDNGESLIMVATDRISCFDVILNNEVVMRKSQSRVDCSKSEVSWAWITPSSTV